MHSTSGHNRLLGSDVKKYGQEWKWSFGAWVDDLEGVKFKSGKVMMKLMLWYLGTCYIKESKFSSQFAGPLFVVVFAWLVVDQSFVNCCLNIFVANLWRWSLIVDLNWLNINCSLLRHHVVGSFVHMPDSSSGKWNQGEQKMHKQDQSTTDNTWFKHRTPRLCSTLNIHGEESLEGM